MLFLANPRTSDTFISLIIKTMYFAIKKWKKNLHIFCSASWIHYLTDFDDFRLQMTVKEWSSVLPRKNWGFQNASLQKMQFLFCSSCLLRQANSDIFWRSWKVDAELFIFPRAGVVLFTNIKESTIAEQSVDITYDYLSPSINNLGSILNQSHLTNL